VRGKLSESCGTLEVLGESVGGAKTGRQQCRSAGKRDVISGRNTRVWKKILHGGISAEGTQGVQSAGGGLLHWGGKS